MKKYRGLLLVILVLVVLGVGFLAYRHLRRPAPTDGSTDIRQEDSTVRDITEEATSRPLPTPEYSEYADFGKEFFEDAIGVKDFRLLQTSIPIRVRIAKDVQVLRSESTDDSLAMLSEIEAFTYPGGGPRGIGILVIPLRKEAGARDVRTVMSNRRFLKLMQELSELSKPQAAKLVSGAIDSILPLYTAMFSEKWDHVVETRVKHPVAGRKRHGVGPSMIMSNNPDHSPTFAGARFKLLSLVLIAGNLELHGARPAVLAVTEEAMRQREHLYGDIKKVIKGDRFSMLTKAGLYSRQILATGIVGTSERGFDASASSEEGASRWEVQELTAYDAASSTYDTLTRHGGPIPPDFTRGKIEVRFHVPLDDEQFDAIAKPVLENRE